MKKAYTKPELFYENFSLMGSIANTCGQDGTKAAVTNSADVSNCGYYDANFGGVIFSTEAVCEILTVGQNLCSSNPMEAITMFGS